MLGHSKAPIRCVFYMDLVEDVSIFYFKLYCGKLSNGQFRLH